MTFRTGIEMFDLWGGDDGLSLHYERDHDLIIDTKAAIKGGENAGLLLIELGIDGSRTHRVRFDVGLVEHDPDAFYYERDEEVRALSDAIETLTALRDQMAAMLESAGS